MANATRTSNSAALDGIVSDVTRATNNYVSNAEHQLTKANEALGETFVLALEVDKAKSIAMDIITRAFNCIPVIDAELARLRAQWTHDITAINTRYSDLVADEQEAARQSRDRDNAIVATRRNYTSQIERLEKKRQDYVNFLGSQVGPFVNDELVVARSSLDGLAMNIQQINNLQISHAYIALRLGGAANAIKYYNEAKLTDEAAAIIALRRGLPTVLDEGQVGLPTDSRGGDWHKAEAELRKIAEEAQRNGTAPVYGPATPPVPMFSVPSSPEARTKLNEMKIQVAEIESEIRKLNTTKQAIVTKLATSKFDEGSQELSLLKVTLDQTHKKILDLEESLRPLYEDIAILENPDAA